MLEAEAHVKRLPTYKPRPTRSKDASAVMNMHKSPNSVCEHRSGWMLIDWWHNPS